MAAITPSTLRGNIYKLLDQVLESGEPLEVNRNGEMLMVVPERRKSRLDRIVPKKITTATDEELIHPNWEEEWKPFI